MDKIDITKSGTLSGKIKCEILNARGDVVESLPEQSNLILDTGLDYFFVNATSGIDAILWAYAGTGTTPTKVELTGTFEQTGTTVTRSTGADTFSGGDVGKRLKFANGMRSKITAYGSSTSVTVDTSQTAAAQVLTKYHTDQVALVTQNDSTSTQDVTAGFKTQTKVSGSQNVIEKKTWVFALRVSPTTYTEVGFGKSGSTNLFSRILLDSPIAVDVDQQLRISYTVTLADDYPIVAEAETLSITGWPRPYDISSIVANGTTFDVTFSEAHHFITGGKLNVDGALPIKRAITGITSTPSDFEVTTSASHGFVTSDSIQIEGCAVGAYNGAWTVASSTATTFVVTSAADPGAASDGTARFAVPGTWFDGEWTIASVPTAESVRITSAITPVDAGESGEGYNNLDCEVVHCRHGFKGGEANGGTNGDGDYLYEAEGMIVGIRRVGAQFAFTGFPMTVQDTGGAFLGNYLSDTEVKTSGGGGIVNTYVIGISSGNFTDIKQFTIIISRGSGSSRNRPCIIVTFDELQRKDTGFQLTVILRRKLHAALE